MIVKCEQCQTRFKIPDEKVTDKGVKVRCTKCSHTFRVTKASAASGAPASSPAPAIPSVAPLPSVAPVSSLPSMPSIAPDPDPFANFGGPMADDPASPAITRPFEFKEGITASKNGIPSVPSVAPSAPQSNLADLFSDPIDEPAPPPPAATKPAAPTPMKGTPRATPVAPPPSLSPAPPAGDLSDLFSPSPPTPAAAKPAAPPSRPAPVAPSRPPLDPLPSVRPVSPLPAAPAASLPIELDLTLDPPPSAPPSPPRGIPNVAFNNLSAKKAVEDPFAALGPAPGKSNGGPGLQLSGAPNSLGLEPAGNLGGRFLDMPGADDEPLELDGGPSAPAPSPPAPQPAATPQLQPPKASPTGQFPIAPPTPIMPAMPPPVVREGAQVLASVKLVQKPVGKPEDARGLDAVASAGAARRVSGMVINISVAAALILVLMTVGSVYLNEGKLDASAISFSRVRSLLFPIRDMVARDVSNGLYETQHGRPVFYVRGEVENRSGKKGKLKVRAEILDGAQLVRAAEGYVGSAPSPEELYAITAAEDLQALNTKLDKQAKEIDPGQRASFLLAFYEYPPDLSSFRLKVTVLEPSGKETATR